MKVRASDTGEETQFQIAPMIDMVFLLLVFFMCASHWSVIQNIEMEIPLAKRSVVPKERPGRFIVNITKDGKIHGGNVEVANMDELKAMVKEEKTFMPEVRIYVRADQATPHKYIKEVMGAMAQLGVDDFIFGTYLPNE